MGTLSPLLQQFLVAPFPLKERTLDHLDGPKEVMKRSKLILKNGPQVAIVSINLPFSMISPSETCPSGPGEWSRFVYFGFNKKV